MQKKELEADPFNQWIEKAIINLPTQFKEELKNVSIVVEDESSLNQNDNTMLLGLYQGVPNPYKGPHYTFTMPDKISLYRNNILAIANYRDISVSKVIEEVLYHEIGHLLGMSETELNQYKSF
jgi:predicted Zn-dependent protease with MMP-like domain